MTNYYCSNHGHHTQDYCKKMRNGPEEVKQEFTKEEAWPKMSSRNDQVNPSKPTKPNDIIMLNGYKEMDSPCKHISP